MSKFEGGSWNRNYGNRRNSGPMRECNVGYGLRRG